MQTVTLDEKEFTVFQLLDSIQRMEQAVKFHGQSDSPDKMAIEQYAELKKRYEKELAETLKSFGIKFRLTNLHKPLIISKL